MTTSFDKIISSLVVEDDDSVEPMVQTIGTV